jgi:hypothetical protein
MRHRPMKPLLLGAADTLSCGLGSRARKEKQMEAEIKRMLFSLLAGPVCLAVGTLILVWTAALLILPHWSQP